MSGYLIKNGTLINEGRRYAADLRIEGNIITEIGPDLPLKGEEPVDARGKLVIPGAIDDQVHFREPGLTHKGDIYTESRAAVAGGVTSFMDMPNTDPPSLTVELLEERYATASGTSLANYSFYMGTSNSNAEEIAKIDPRQICGVKVFMGASTGNMLVDSIDTLNTVFATAKTLVAVHCEDEPTIQANLAEYKSRFGDDIPVRLHPEIRSREACLKSSSLAISLARKHNTRLHILHLSTADELALLSNAPLQEKRITAEVCVHHLWFSNEDYARLGAKIKWNPAIKEASDRKALRNAVKNGLIDIVATDHAPHTREEKQNPYTSCPSGAPLVQHSLPAMLELCHGGVFSPELVVEKMCHNPARLFQIKKRGFLREGYYADIVLIDPDNPWQVNAENLKYKCGWSPLEGETFTHRVSHTFVNGNLVYSGNEIIECSPGMRLEFDR